MHKYSLLLISLILSTLPATVLSEAKAIETSPNNHSQTKQTLSLEQILTRVYAHHPQLWKLRADYKIAETRIRQARIGTSPELNLIAEDILGSAAFTSDRFTQVTLEWAQTILLGDKINLKIHLAQLNQQLQYWDYQVQVHELRQQVYLHYGQLLNLQAEAALIQDFIDNAQKIHGLLSLSVQRGKLAPQVLYQSEIALKSLQAEQLQLQLKHKLASQSLAAFWGDAQADFQVTPDLQLLNLDSREDLRQYLAFHPRLARWKTEQQQRQASLDFAMAQGIADLTMAGGLRYHAPFDWGLVLSWGIPLHFNNPQQGHIDEARLRQDMWQKEKQIEAQALQNQFEQAYELVLGQKPWLVVLQEQVELAQLQQAATINAFEAGKLNYLEVLNATQNRMSQRRQLQAAQAEHVLAILKLKAITLNHKTEEILLEGQ